ncbi:MAG TPA: glycosyltransferase family 4 protein [Gemmatimonadota bacterium]|nr:glycosyltransferase family 4 protein [Gemmatimonadota bacterium]
MRLLHVVTAWPRHPGDVITPWLVALCERQAARGHAVEVLAPAWRGLGDGEESGVRVHRYRYAPARWERLTHEEATPDRLQRQPAYALALPGYLAAGARAARRLGRERRYEVVHVHWAVPHGVHGLAAARGAGPGCSLVTTFYGAEIRWAERKFPPGKTFLRWYCRRSRLVAISESTRSMLAPYAGGAPIDVVPYGVPFPDAAAGGPRAPADPPVLLFVGRLVARKGVDRLLEALARVEDRPWRLEVIGFGPEREALEVRARELGLTERVAFLGQVSDDALVEAYRRATALVLPATLDRRSDTEGLGVVLLEAMACGVPVVATRMGGIVDVVVHGETGWLVEDEIEGLERGVRRALEDPARAREMGEAGRARVREVFGWDKILDRLDAVYSRGSGGT